VSPPIHPLTSSQGAVFLINSRQGYFSCGPSYEGQALYRRYGRFFAEFLGDLSLVRLGLLDLTTCVGLRYGFYMFMLRSFSWKRALRALLGRSFQIAISLEFLIKQSRADLPTQHSHDTDVKSNNAPRILPFVHPSQHTKVQEY